MRGLMGLIIAIATAIPVSSLPVQAEPLRFEGRVEAMRNAELSSRLNGVIAEIAFEGGESVVAGDPLITLDPADFEIAVKVAEAELARVRAGRTLAEAESERAERLSERGVAAEAQLQAAEAALAVATADVTAAEAALARAKLDLSRTVIRAPMDGLVSRPLIAVGAFVEAEAGPPLGRIVQLDTVLVAYRVPYAVRMATMKEAGAPNLQTLFERIDLALVLPDDSTHPHRSKPRFADAALDPETGEAIIWAEFSNPDGVLRPGMNVTVLSLIGEAAQ
ncbi:MAG: efflux RND transporter periplasmic adaptor subunit [Pseudomonadota bacterium]